MNIVIDPDLTGDERPVDEEKVVELFGAPPDDAMLVFAASETAQPAADVGRER